MSQAGRPCFARMAALLCMATAAVTTQALAGPPAGTTIDYEYDATDVGHPDWAWQGRAYLHPSVTASPDQPRPIVVFLHGVNSRFARHYWMGSGGDEPDVRVWFDELLASGTVEPAVLAAPSAQQACTLPQALFTGFDLDRFLDRTVRAIRGVAVADLSRVIVVGHSGAGCNLRGGLITALRGSTTPKAALAVDVCLDPYEASGYALAQVQTDLVFTWQRSWRRKVREFERRLVQESEARGARGSRVVQELPTERPNPHEAILKRSLERWLPVWIPAR